MRGLFAKRPSRHTSALAQALDPIAGVPGVTDYILLDAKGAPVMQTTNFGYDDERLRRCTELLRRSAVLVRIYLGGETAAGRAEGAGEPLAFLFRNGWVLVWQMQTAALVVFGREGLDLPTLRMRVSILRSELSENKRLGRLLGEPSQTDVTWLSETAASDEERRWIHTLCREQSS
jgi:hypothetical protein